MSTEKRDWASVLGQFLQTAQELEREVFLNNSCEYPAKR